MTEQREVRVKGALALHMFKQRLTGMGVAYEVVPPIGDVPEENYTEYYTNHTVRISATEDQWVQINQWLDRTRHVQPGT